MFCISAQSRGVLNNLDVRLQIYCPPLGRMSDLWHGDVKQSARNESSAIPPIAYRHARVVGKSCWCRGVWSCAGLFGKSPRGNYRRDPCFAGDDRGWHLLAVLERIGRLAGRELQRIGLSSPSGIRTRLSNGWPDRLAEPEAFFFRPKEVKVRPMSHSIMSVPCKTPRSWFHACIVAKNALSSSIAVHKPNSLDRTSRFGLRLLCRTVPSVPMCHQPRKHSCPAKTV